MQSKPLTILAIETSCDETAIAILKFNKNGKFRILSNIIASQIKIHSPYGGVVPHLAAREHEKNLPYILKQIKPNWKKIDYIAVTAGPGLSPCLWRGINFAKNLAEKHNKPIISINHLEGHIYSSGIKNYESSSAKQPLAQARIMNYDFPALALIVSGGHTQLVLVKDHLKYKILGQTLDDAAGEAFDKTAKLLELGYPGGPIVSKLAESGNPKKYDLPRPMMHSDNFNFSFSGLKTAVLYMVRDLEPLSKKQTKDICASFEQAVIDVLMHKTLKAIQKYKPKTILFGGGVLANKLLRSTIEKQIPHPKSNIPHPKYCGDNAAMIALSAYYHAIKNTKQCFVPTNINKLEANPNWNF
ncbi:tRNA (adenosine(37)-N6)-threonylcarbamoyltransferase complex transferase subunit TsaD [bacterium]|nr:tRNA (adenosine(37)-N6)-threonylcarbamoyltransferase complex transferase subunit TsaD [bacterium]|tara:strand:+ start:33604 stop:34674 length:1071 start_codon:yes stop_codon:yes gene_type:complete